MRVRIRHEITQRFEPGSRNVSVLVRLTPRPHEGQFIQRWTLDLDTDCRLLPQEDAFGNVCHAFSQDGPTDHFTIVADGEVETFDTTGIVRGTVERFPPSLYLRPTDLTTAGAAVAAFAEGLERHDGDPLSDLHALMVALHAAVKESEGPAMGDPMNAEEALTSGSACSGGIAHVFTAAARHLGIPARHISGYFAEEEQGAARHWAEAHVAKIGWVAFDCGRNQCPTENYVRLAIGLDAVGVAPLRSTGTGLKESVSAQDSRLGSRRAQAQQQSQN